MLAELLGVLKVAGETMLRLVPISIALGVVFAVLTHWSACNPGTPWWRKRGIVTDVVRDAVMAKVEIQAGPYRLVSLMSREAADDLGLETGVLAVAVVKSTNVVVERAD